MKHYFLGQWLAPLLLIVLILCGCATGETTDLPILTSSSIPTSTLTPAITSSPTPILPTLTPTPALPRATSTPASGVGVPIAAGGWQVTIEDARQETKVSKSGLTIMPGGGLGVSTSTTNASPGFIFLVVQTIFRNLAPFAQTEILAKDVTVIDENGKEYVAGDLSESPGEFVFAIEEAAIDQIFELHLRDVPLVSFSVEQESEPGFATEINVEPGLLPYVCKIEDLPVPGKTGRLAFYRLEEPGFALGHIDPDGSKLNSVCNDIAFGELQFAADGAALLLVTPSQGWSSLYLIEPEGEVYSIVSNGLNIEARFAPTGQWVLFATDKVGQTSRELYSFNRETVAATLVHAGEQIDFDFLTNGRLITNYRKTGESDRQIYMGPVDGKNLESLKLPKKIAGYAMVSNNAQSLVYREVNASFSGFGLYMSGLDNNNVQELAQSQGLRLSYALSPDDRAIVMAVGDGERGDRVELRNLSIDESWTIATGIETAAFSFSADSQWASVVTTVDDQSTLYVINVTDGNIQEIEDAVNAYFSPDSTRLAYTLRQSNGDVEMFVTTLDSETGQSLGHGVITGWFPSNIIP